MTKMSKRELTRAAAKEQKYRGGRPEVSKYAAKGVPVPYEHQDDPRARAERTRRGR